MTWMKMLSLPVTALVDNLSTFVQARSLSNAREAAADTGLKRLAYEALTSEIPADLELEIGGIGA